LTKRSAANPSASNLAANIAGIGPPTAEIIAFPRDRVARRTIMPDNRLGIRERIEALTWAAMVPFAKKLRLPILAVDGEDAVAVYRVMQESVIRARYGGGPAVLWTVTTPPGTALTRGRQPLARLERYLAVRKIKLPRR